MDFWPLPRAKTGRSVARIEWVKQRLDNWALWKDRESHGGLGFATRSVLLSDAVDRYRETPLPVDEVTIVQLLPGVVVVLMAAALNVYQASCLETTEWFSMKIDM